MTKWQSLLVEGLSSTGPTPSSYWGLLCRGMFSVGNPLSELLITTEMAFGKGNQMSIEGSPCLVKGNILSSRHRWKPYLSTFWAFSNLWFFKCFFNCFLTSYTFPPTIVFLWQGAKISVCQLEREVLSTDKQWFPLPNKGIKSHICCRLDFF